MKQIGYFCIRLIRSAVSFLNPLIHMYVLHVTES
jgi:hypothetical protein